jgi:uncharacterized protein (TIGR00299 family) protein
MKILYLDCFSGISGDMFLSALLDLGLPIEVLQATVNRLSVPVAITRETVFKNSLRATRVIFREQAPQPPGRSLGEMREILNESRLEPPLRNQVNEALLRLAEAEAAAHGTHLEQVHFHEIGGLDTLVDLACTFTGLSHLGVEKVYCAPLPLGRGSIETAHGTIPLPAPATLNLLRGVPTYGLPIEAELVTPTGAVLATMLTGEYGLPPAAVWERIGYGAGSRDLPIPNLLRLWLGEMTPSGAPNNDALSAYDQDRVLVLETQVDDSNPEFIPYLRTKLTDAGAIDITVTPVIMKKGRLGQLLSVLAPPECLFTLCEIILHQSTALGLRWYEVGRVKLFRKTIEVRTAYGPVALKIGYSGRDRELSQIVNIAPEYEDCARLAEESGASLKDVYQAALAAAEAVKLSG